MPKLSRTINLRVPEKIYGMLAEAGHINERANEIFSDMRMLEMVSDQELKDKLNGNLWLALYETFKGNGADCDRYSVDGLLHACRNAEIYRHTFSNNGCTVRELETVMKGLYGIHANAILRRVREAEAAGLTDLNEWANW